MTSADATSLTALTVTRDDLPKLARDASESARWAQDRLMLLAQVDLYLLFITALVTSIQWSSSTVIRITAFATAAFMLGGFLIARAIQRDRYEEKWLNGRAIAESVKSLAWRYMMRTPPFEGNGVSIAADCQYASDFNRLVEPRIRFTKGPLGFDHTTAEISLKMRDVRRLDPASRGAVYLAWRAGRQCTWYRDEATENEEFHDRWNRIIVAAQGLGVLGALLLIVMPKLPFSLAGVFATVAASGLAWSQLKRFKELSQAYDAAADQLSKIIARTKSISTEEHVSALVAEAESAITSEHTTWIARHERG